MNYNENMDEVKVRSAEKKDAAQIAKIHVGTWQYAYRGQVPNAFLDSLSVEQRTTHWQDTLSRSEQMSQTFVAELNSRVIGFCSVGPCRDADMDKSTGELFAIYVDADFMNKGAGSDLEEVGLNYLKVQGYKKATLWVISSNEKTIKWYKNKGWEAEGKTKIDERDGFQLLEERYIKVL
jgi:L-amino acid N-acyltransferase YncA